MAPVGRNSVELAPLFALNLPRNISGFPKILRWTELVFPTAIQGLLSRHRGELPPLSIPVRIRTLF